MPALGTCIAALKPFLNKVLTNITIETSHPSTVVPIFYTNTALNSRKNTKRIESLSYLFINCKLLKANLA